MTRGHPRARLGRFEQSGASISGEMEYVVDGRHYTHAFSAKLLTEEELDEDLAAVGLERRRVLDERGAWIEAVLKNAT